MILLVNCTCEIIIAAVPQLVRDPRWGRNQEVYSEDPRLTSVLTHGYVAGIQNGGSWDPPPGGGVLQAGACCKHLAAYDVEGCSEGPVCNGQNRMTNDANITTRSMWEHYLPAFHSCTVEAKALHAMCSYNSINGIPTWYVSKYVNKCLTCSNNPMFSVITCLWLPRQDLLSDMIIET